MKVNLELIRKYNVAGPRYTSYPPATKFTERVTWASLADEVIETNRSARELSLYFHLPFCQTLCWYCGCNTVITTDQKQSGRYLDYLEKQIKQMAAVLNPKRKVVQLHFGGGTPTFLLPSEIERLGEIIHKHFKMAPGAEAGVEIDPRRLTREHLVALRRIGFNRISVGVQDFNPAVQLAVHRVQPLGMTKRVLDWVKELGFASINIDLIYGLPMQTVETFAQTIEEVLRLHPERIALFSYAHVPWIKPSQKILERWQLPRPEEKLAIFKMAVEKLTAGRGYTCIGMDHFALPTDDLAKAQALKLLHRNFQGYSTHGGADIYAFGISGISQIPNAYWQNEKELPAYYEALDAGKAPVIKGYIMTDDDKIRRETIMRLMCDMALNFYDISRKFGINFVDYFAKELESLSDLEQDGLIRFSTFGIEVTNAGRLLIRNIAMRFDTASQADGERRYSKTI